ncbi:hypothetical protein SODALDRAFT_291442 [Sodiomyces alkalinus F11]|uniref:FHA domain-containing protein n=1 Tax=Sodiomyces alkalinus (strain CBS 110278 / VKM F-3762 / F11) TaxID=1314773 RepID=A0A3N2Q2M7_SODAK|nr:hypothetical protein SODALDRAFT_291442 [Sodiomyces alkalinus F11]ROT40982.1 hypothetical protein SODALDRAFT_291442 [Sodiomyces alkalinus F11]
MTAVANPPSFPQLNRSAWNVSSGQDLNSMNSEDVRGMFMPRKQMQRTNSSSSISSTSSASSTATVSTNNSAHSNGTPSSANSDVSTWSNAAARKRPPLKSPWPSGKSDVPPPELGRMPPGRSPANGINGVNHNINMNGIANGSINGGPMPPVQGQPSIMSQQQMSGRPIAEPMPAGQPVLYLLSLNGTFERKTISVPFYPESLRIGRQTNQKTVPTPANGFFDSKVLSRQHAEIWADRMGKIYIRDVKSSNGTFVNGSRLSQENRESEPHELQSGDHLELGIDIVNEDQKTVVHHKVAAKVEHAGFMNASSSILDLNFGDLDPANGTAMLGPPPTGLALRGRQGSNATLAANGRGLSAAGVPGSQMVGGAGRGTFQLASVTSDHIIKRLQTEMRNAKLQSQDLGRTGQFIGALLSKHDVKDLEKPEAPEPPKPLVNGNPMSFRSDPKARFSDPPAPPPQQPLPEKPDVPPLKRATTERPKSQTSGSPVRADNMSQILQLTEALSTTRRELDSQTARMRDLEEMLQKEREARELAEDLARRLEDTAISKVVDGAPEADGTDGLLREAAFEPPCEAPESVDVEMIDADSVTVTEEAPPQVESVENVASQFQAKIDAMVLEISDLRQQMEAWKARCETAEAERNTDRQSLADMVLKIRKDEEARQAAAEVKARSRSSAARRGGNRSRSRSLGRSPSPRKSVEESRTTAGDHASSEVEDAQKQDEVPEDPSDKPTLSRANTITPNSVLAPALSQRQVLIEGIPYASMLGVVLLGVGLMAYINGWEAPRPRQ